MWGSVVGSVLRKGVKTTRNASLGTLRGELGEEAGREEQNQGRE